jgi:catechol 2,3-dioxygenase-like lactoylglutathione lyase family enzyme
MKLQLSLIELVVADMAATLAFYRRLGLDIPADADKEPHVDIELTGGMRLAFDTEDTIKSFDPKWQRPADPAEVDSAYSDLTGAGYEGHLPPWDAFWGMRYAVVHDPDGTPVDLFAFLPAS